MNYKEACELAKSLSVRLHYVQHVQLRTTLIHDLVSGRTKPDFCYEVSGSYDDENTVVSYENGSRLP